MVISRICCLKLCFYFNHTQTALGNKTERESNLYEEVTVRGSPGEDKSGLHPLVVLLVTFCWLNIFELIVWEKGKLVIVLKHFNYTADISKVLYNFQTLSDKSHCLLTKGYNLILPDIALFLLESGGLGGLGGRVVKTYIFSNKTTFLVSKGDPFWKDLFVVAVKDGNCTWRIKVINNTSTKYRLICTSKRKIRIKSQIFYLFKQQ